MSCSKVSMGNGTTFLRDVLKAVVVNELTGAADFGIESGSHHSSPFGAGFPL